MFDYDVAVYYLGQLVDNIRVSAENALKACEEVERISKPYFQNWNCHELSAKRVVNGPIIYPTYFGDLVEIK